MCRKGEVVTDVPEVAREDGGRSHGIVGFEHAEREVEERISLHHGNGGHVRHVREARAHG